MSVAYTGNLVAFMTDPGLEAPLDTPAKILEKNLPIGMYNYQARRGKKHQNTNTLEALRKYNANFTFKIIFILVQGSTTLAFSTTTNEEYKEVWDRHHWIKNWGESFKNTIKGIVAIEKCIWEKKKLGKAIEKCIWEKKRLD
jgi:hypothetical protein